MRLFQEFRYGALAEPSRVVEVRLNDIELVTRDCHLIKRYYPGVVVRSFGDEPLVSRVAAARDRYKPRALREHFVRGVPWEETELFTRVYAQRLRNGEVVRGCRSLEELVRDYEQNIDPLFDSLKTEGVRPPGPANPDIDPIYLHVGATGAFISGSNGNHRMYMADILGIETMPFMIFSRHVAWQAVRECASRGVERLEEEGFGDHVSHPDLADVIY